MEMIIVAVFGLLLLAVLAAIANEGLWSNAIALVNIVTAALVATNFFEPMSAWWRTRWPGGVHVWDFLALWLLFAVVYSIMKAATDFLSKTRVRFPLALDRAGGYFFAAWVGWVLVCFTAMTFHTAPLARDFLFGGFKPENDLLFGLDPDRQWLGFMQRESLSALGRSAPADDPEKHVFDPKGEFMIKYAARRAVMEKGNGVWVKAGPPGPGGAK
ncbi:MAG: CvpA family protein [Planctomycetia bacterium]|nr:CvpA family protein [Planctomycetia bacterium]